MDLFGKKKRQAALEEQKRQKQEEIAQIMAMPASLEYDRFRLLFNKEKWNYALWRQMIDDENVKELTFEEVKSLQGCLSLEYILKACAKLVNFPDWCHTDMYDWKQLAIRLGGIRCLVETFPFEVWQNQPTNMVEILKYYTAPYDILHNSPDKREAVVVFFSDKRNFQAYFEDTRASFAKFFEAKNFADEAYRKLFGNNFAENTLERAFQIELAHYDNENKNIIEILEGFEEDQVVAFIKRNRFDNATLKEFADKKPKLLEYYVACHYLNSDIRAEFRKRFPDFAYADYFYGKEATMSFCREKGIAEAFLMLPRLEKSMLQAGLAYLSEILAKQINCEVKPEYWQPVLHAINPLVYLEVMQDKLLLKTLTDAGFTATEEFLVKVEKTREQIEMSKIDLC